MRNGIFVSYFQPSLEQILEFPCWSDGYNKCGSTKEIETKKILLDSKASVLCADGRCSCGTWGLSCDSYCDHESFAIFRTWDTEQRRPKKFYAFEESSDTSGHGCRCGMSLTEWDTLEDAVNLGLNQENRERFRARKG